jgi:hypothetical protein
MAALAERPGSVRLQALCSISLGVERDETGHHSTFLSLRVLLDEALRFVELEARLPISLACFLRF